VGLGSTSVNYVPSAPIVHTSFSMYHGPPEGTKSRCYPCLRSETDGFQREICQFSGFPSMGSEASRYKSHSPNFARHLTTALLLVHCTSYRRMSPLVINLKALVSISALLGSTLAFASAGGSHVDFSQHPYKAPGPNDLRGPCPGLNTYVNLTFLTSG
jgi:hypothetical protein